MRRGHPGIGRWRNDNQRPYRPRGGRIPHFRPSRGYGPPDMPRYPPPRPLLDVPRFGHPGPAEDTSPPDHHNRKYHPGNRQNSQRGHGRNIFPMLHHMRHGDTPDNASSYMNSQKHFEGSNQGPNYINVMGDVDHRSLNTSQNREPYNQPIQVWNVPPQIYEERNQSKPYRRHENGAAEYDHRIPPPDHYGGTSASTENSKTFSRSVNDTVDIVRKRLLSRESHLDDTPADQTISETSAAEPPANYPQAQQEQPKKKIQKVKPNIKRNCDKIKNKIVHQLFMMDKDKIHKLMDNPSSSTKFEYAISSLVTESQNSFNRHLRSQAEKSLGTTEFVHNQNNTIYEDTFMKQMRALLDPQDTVLLEDLKPVVLAELSKVLQLDNLEIQGVTGDQFNYAADLSFEQHPTEYYNYDETPNFDYYEKNPPPTSNESNKNILFNEFESNCNSQQNSAHSSHLYERRKPQKSCDYSRDRSPSVDEQQSKRDYKTIDSHSTDDKYRRSGTPLPLFDGNAEHLSEDEDPFAELDRQYHVAVDHTFIDIDDINTMQPQQVTIREPQTPSIKKEVRSNFHTPEKPHLTIPETKKRPPTSLTENSYKVKQEIHDQLLSIAKSPLKFTSPVNIKAKTVDEVNLAVVSDFPSDTAIKQETLASESMSTNTTPIKQTDDNKQNTSGEKIEIQTDISVTNETTPKSEESGSSAKSSTPSRKRSDDQKPSHRKEKRKKSESNQHEPNKQVLNKNIIINVNDCAAKSSEKCEPNVCAPKSVFNLFFSKDQNKKDVPKENKKGDSVDKSYLDKYVKRKEILKKPKETEKNKHDASSSSHSIISPADSSNNSVSSQALSKTDTNTKFKSIDIFEDHSKKSGIHQSHRNTTTVPSTHKTAIEVKCKPLLQISRKMTRKHVSTQVYRKTISKEIQTERKRLTTRGMQTDPVMIKLDSKINSTDPFERMKEIDMEIQSLLQEKFKLYSSIESKESCSNSMQSLGMAVLNVTPYEDEKATDECHFTEDNIVDDFVNIPVEELEKIALESVQDENNECKNKSKRAKVVQENRKNSISTTKKNAKKKAKTPNISLIEQIITDDRPLEDIISLDDLEMTPAKSKKKVQKTDDRSLEDIISLDDLEMTPAKSKKKVQKPDDRSLEDIISLDDLEMTPAKSKKKVQKPKKKPLKKQKNTKMKKTPVKQVFEDKKIIYDIKPCSVVLVRHNINKYVNPKPMEPVIQEVVADVPETLEEPNEILESVINDIQFDMLDVSEDIVIGDMYELKSEGKGSNDVSVVPICEDIILDNSQSSVEDAAGADGGSSDGICKTFDYSSDENLKRDTVVVTGNGDAVLAIECVENDFIAACLDGNVYHFGPDGQLRTTLRGSNLAVTCLTIVKEKYGTTVYTGSLDSRIRYYDLESGLEKGPECNVLSPIQTMDRAWDTIFVGTKTGFVLQFECKNNMLIPVSTVKFSEQSIMALRAMKEGPRKVLLVAARSENVTIKDAQTGLLLRTLDGPKMTVYTLLFEDGKVYCGTSSQLIHVFDYSSGSHVGSHEGGKGAVCLRAAGGLLFAGCYDGCVYVYREGEPKPFAQLRGPSPMLLSLAVVDTKIIAGYKDRSLYIWKIPLTILQEMIL